ncbi:hypothetical protein L198_04716 [Cryptococcus wingfieldii CBS 7118]|uniref:Uncharacterized protein n=1 Tax=Cryptococcus wingfieldii CBS 7118 TaxID=1295528 RepID=A0A1E3J382_9TREE|nr:hypothetical protein L198_04716 [Cryptococcus wingfieldii CBS 7118]ODN95320.1 hypothetical protein L198_04716 [Cryptococcus wingfieldii CBS 7118]
MKLHPPPIVHVRLPSSPSPSILQLTSITIGHVICYIALGSILKFQNPNNIQIEVGATVRRYYGADYTLFQRALIIRNYVEAQLLRLVEEFKLNKPFYTDLNHSGLTHGGLPLLIYHSKTTYLDAIQKGGSTLQPHYFEHGTTDAREVTKGSIEGKRVEVERAVGSVVCKKMMAERHKREAVAV